MKIDKSLFKGKDLGLVNEIMSYLNEYGLDAEVRGGVRNNFEKGNLRHYRDIDLVVRYDESAGRYNALMGLIHAKNEINKIKGHSSKIEEYVNLTVDHRFAIVDNKTNTIIDLCFEKNPSVSNKKFHTLTFMEDLPNGIDPVLSTEYDRQVITK